MSARIPSPNYSSGRAAPIRLVVLHTAQTPCQPGRARGIANYLAGSGVGASCHWTVDPDDEVQQVLEQDTAWAAPGANADGIQIEQAAYAEFTAGEWGLPEQRRMLERTARLVAGICQRHGLPIKALTNGELAAGAAGIVHHVQVSEVYQRSDHWDCGGNFPMAAVVARAREIAGGSPPIDPEELTVADITALTNAINKWGTYNQQQFDHLKRVLDEGRVRDVDEVVVGLERRLGELAAADQHLDRRLVDLIDAVKAIGGGEKPPTPVTELSLQELFARQQELNAEIQRRMSAKDEAVA